MRNIRRCVFVLILLLLPASNLHGTTIEAFPPITPQNIDQITLFAELFGEESAEGFGVAFSPDGRWLVFGGPGNTQVWDTAIGTRVYALSAATVNNYDFSADSSRFVGGGTNIFVASPEQQRQIMQVEASHFAITKLSPDGTQIAYSVNNVRENYKIHILDSETGELVQEIVYRDTDRETLDNPDYNSDGSLIAVTYENLDRDVCLDDDCNEILEHGAIIFDSATGQELALFNSEDDKTEHVLFIPNTTLLIVSTVGRTYFWDYVKDEIVATIDHPEIDASSGLSINIAMNQSGTILALADHLPDGMIEFHFWDISEPEAGIAKLSTFQVEGTLAIGSFGFGANDRLFAVSSANKGVLRLYGIVDESSCIARSSGEFANMRVGPAGYFQTRGRLNKDEQAVATGHAVDASYEYWQLYGDNWVRADVVQMSGDCEPLKVPADVCKISPPIGGSANLRIGPATGFPQAASMVTDDVHVAIGRTSDGAGFTWWQINGNLWVRDDVVNKTGMCEAVPEIIR